METAVRKATRLEYRPPKEKHLLTLKNLTLQNPACIDGIITSLEKRLKERSWIITYKVLIVVHYLMREGNSNAMADGVLKRPSVLDASNVKKKSSASQNVQNICLYQTYLEERIIAFRYLKRDYASKKQEGRLRHLKLSEGLLEETAALQRQLESVLNCKFYLNKSDSLPITYMAYRMTIEDLLVLFQSINEAVVNILENYFEMSKSEAKKALEIYKSFAKQTEYTIDYLNDAKRLQNDLKMSIPEVKHAPISLASALEDYLNESDTIKDQSEMRSTLQEPQMNEILPQTTNNNSQQISIMNNSPPPLIQNPFQDIMNQHPQPVSNIVNPPFATVSYRSSGQMADNNPFRSLRASSYGANDQQANSNKLEIQPFSQQLTGITNNNTTNPFSTVPVTPPLTPHQPYNSFSALQMPQPSNTVPQNHSLNPFNNQYSYPPSAF